MRLLFVCTTAYTLHYLSTLPALSALSAQAYIRKHHTGRANRVLRHREGVKLVGAIGFPPSLCPTDALPMPEMHTAVCYECR